MEVEHVPTTYFRKADFLQLALRNAEIDATVIVGCGKFEDLNTLAVLSKENEGETTIQVNTRNVKITLEKTILE